MFLPRVFRYWSGSSIELNIFFCHVEIFRFQRKEITVGSHKTMEHLSDDFKIKNPSQNWSFSSKSNSASKMSESRKFRNISSNFTQPSTFPVPKLKFYSNAKSETLTARQADTTNVIFDSWSEIFLFSWIFCLTLTLLHKASFAFDFHLPTSPQRSQDGFR